MFFITWDGVRSPGRTGEFSPATPQGSVPTIWKLFDNLYARRCKIKFKLISLGYAKVLEILLFLFNAFFSVDPLLMFVSQIQMIPRSICCLLVSLFLRNLWKKMTYSNWTCRFNCKIIRVHAFYGKLMWFLPPLNFYVVFTTNAFKSCTFTAHDSEPWQGDCLYGANLLARFWPNVWKTRYKKN